MNEDDWFRERYEAALLDDHEKGHPGRPSPVETCWHCRTPSGQERVA